MPVPFIGEVRIFAGNFAPAGWAFCNGQVLSIAPNTALFSLLGTTYGGDGVTTFALPDLRGRVPIQPGQGPGLSLRSLGESGGEESHTMIQPEMPAHAHTFGASTAAGTSVSPVGAVPAVDPAAIPQYRPAADGVMAPGAVMATGSGQPHNNIQPYLTLNYIIALQGIFPARP